MRNQLCTICLAWGPEVAKHNRVPSLDCDGYRNLSLARLARKNLMPQSGVPGRYRPKEARGQSVSWGQIALFCCLFAHHPQTTQLLDLDPGTEVLQKGTGTNEPVAFLRHRANRILPQFCFQTSFPDPQALRAKL